MMPPRKKATFTDPITIVAVHKPMISPRTLTLPMSKPTQIQQTKGCHGLDPYGREVGRSENLQI